MNTGEISDSIKAELIENGVDKMLLDYIDERINLIVQQNLDDNAFATIDDVQERIQAFNDR